MTSKLLVLGINVVCVSTKSVKNVMANINVLEAQRQRKRKPGDENNAFSSRHYN